MEWLDRLNESLSYLENNLTGNISYEEAAKIACCSTFHYQRMFSYIAGVPLAEYIRRRRMTLAAFDLINGARVIDTAMKYGYESPTSFNRAFQSVHGVSPSMAQKEEVKLKAFPRISFQITIKGDVEMDFQIVKKEAFRIVGVKMSLEKEIEKNFQMVPGFWGETAKSGYLEKICAIMDQDIKGVMGLSVCMNNLDKWEYYIAVASEQPVPEGMSAYTVPAGTWAVFHGSGAMPTAIQELEKRAVTEWLPTSGYEYGNAPDIELYLNTDPVNAEFEVWVPVAKK